MILVGVDPGQAQDPTAISVVERTEISAEERKLVRGVEHKRFINRLDVIHCERLALHTTYPKVVDRVVDVVTEAQKLDEDIHVLLDLTGVGRPVRDMMATRVKRLYPVTITSGQSATFDRAHGEWHVPKRVLVSVTAIALQNRGLTINSGIPDAKLLVHELENFKAKITKSGNDTYEAWRDGDHDDLVLATALCVWWAGLHGGKWTETHIGAEVRIKREVIRRNEKRLARQRSAPFRGGGVFHR
jgi:hypothetical protein